MTEPEKPVPVQYLVTNNPPKTNHILHLLLSVFTFGLWLPVWLLVTAGAKARRTVTMVYTEPPPPERRGKLSVTAWVALSLCGVAALVGVFGWNGLGDAAPVLVIVGVLGANAVWTWPRS